MNHKQAVQAVALILAVIGGGTFFIIGLASKADDFNTTVPPAELWPVSIASYTGLLLIYIAAIVYGQIALIASDEFPAVTKFCGRYDGRDCCGVSVLVTNMILLICLITLLGVWSILCFMCDFSPRFVHHIMFTCLVIGFTALGMFRLSRAYRRHGAHSRMQTDPNTADLNTVPVAMPVNDFQGGLREGLPGDLPDDLPNVSRGQHATIYTC